VNRAGAAVLAATLVVLAGCSGGVANGTAPAGDGVTDSACDSETVAPGDDGSAGPFGSVNFYVSDRPGEMDDFEHLNVTVTTVRFHLVEHADNSTDNGPATTDSSVRAGEWRASAWPALPFPSELFYPLLGQDYANG